MKSFRRGGDGNDDPLGHGRNTKRDLRGGKCRKGTRASITDPVLNYIATPTANDPALLHEASIDGERGG